MEFIKIIRDRNSVIHRDAINEAIILLSYVIIGSTLPVWAGIVLIILFSKEVIIYEFFKHGEFAIYSAAMFAPSLYIILKDIKTSKFANRDFFAIICVIGMLISSLIFAGVSTAFTLCSTVVGERP